MIVFAAASRLALPAAACFWKILSVAAGFIFGGPRTQTLRFVAGPGSSSHSVTAHCHQPKKKNNQDAQCPLLHCGIALGKTGMSGERRTGLPIVLGSRCNKSHSLSTHSNLIDLSVVLKNERSSKLSLFWREDIPVNPSPCNFRKTDSYCT